ncbi:Ig-like domain-containing protein, partial [Pseudomonadota bacterium]
MYQTRSCNPGGCSSESQCTASASCAAPTLTINSFEPIPATGNSPLNNVYFTIDVGGTASGPITYELDCTADNNYDQSVTNNSDPFTSPPWCDYPAPGNYLTRVRVSRDGQIITEVAPVTVLDTNISIDSFIAIPDTGTAPLNDVDFTINISGTATGLITYEIDCTTDGTYDQSDINASDPFTAVDWCDYPTGGTHTATVQVTRGGVSTTAATIVDVNQPPTVNIDSVNVTNSPNGLGGGNIYVLDDVQINASASDIDGSIVRVEFYEDNGATFISQDTTSPYQADILGITAGTHTLIARAYDDDGGFTDSAPFIVDVVNLFGVGGGGVIEDEDGAAVCLPDATLPNSPTRCNFTGGEPVVTVDTGLPGTPSTITAEQGGVDILSVDVAADGTYPPLLLPPGDYIIRLTVGDNAIWFCGRPSSCTYSVTLPSNPNPPG